MSNWLTKLLGIDPESKKRRAELKTNIDVANAKLDEMQVRLAQMGQDSKRRKSTLTQTMSGFGSGSRPAQGS